jgi:hypothetical protein
MSQQIRDIENALARVYKKIYTEIKKDSNYPKNLNTIKQKFNRLVNDNTRSAVEQVVIEGSKKVNKKFKTQPFLSQADLNLIREQTDKHVASFWRKIQMDTIRQQEIDNQNKKAVQQQVINPLDTKAYLESVATHATFSPYALSTLSKMGELLPNAFDLFVPFPLADIGDATATGGETITEKPLVEWQTAADERVCPICDELDGTQWEFDDESILIPVDDSHENCRCTVEPV